MDRGPAPVGSAKWRWAGAAGFRRVGAQDRYWVRNGREKNRRWLQGVEFRPLLRFVLGLMQVADGAEAVRAIAGL